MKVAPISQDESERLAALASYRVLDTAYEPVFDAITHLAGTICEVPIALISLVDRDRQWFKSVHGLPGVTQTSRDLAFCAHAILHEELMEVADAARDDRFHDNALVTGDPSIRFYAGMPLISEGGYALGTLCVIDRQPRTLSDRQRSMMRELAIVVMKLLEARRIQARAARLGRVLDQSFGEIYVVDGATLRIEEASRGALRATGYSPAEIVALGLGDLFPDQSPTGIRGRVAALVQGAAEEVVFEAQCCRRDRSLFPSLVSLSAVRGDDGATVALLCVGVDITERKRQEEALRNLVGEKETLLKEVYHRVKNNLQVVTSLLRLQMRTLSSQEGRLALQESADRVQAMALVHERLYQSADLSSISLETYVGDLSRHLVHAAAAPQRGIQLVTEIEPVQVPLDLAVSLGLLINELISNSLKHGYPEGRHGRIHIRFRREEGGAGILEVSDDGIGLPENRGPEARESLGLKLVTTLCRQIGGEFELTSPRGACARVRFNLDGTKRNRA